VKELTYVETKVLWNAEYSFDKVVLRDITAGLGPTLSTP
jgi:hypothetical protein